MKRTVTVVSLIIFCLLAAIAAAPYCRQAQETARRDAAYTAYKHKMGYDKPLALGPETCAVLDGADRVETFHLQGGDEDENAGQQAALQKAYDSPRYLGDYLILGDGPVQGKPFGAALHAALAQGTSAPDSAQCFMPGVGFRAWKGQAHTDVCVCFTCSGVEVTTKDAKHTLGYHSLTILGASRPALLALSRQAFPQDKQLAAVRNQL